MASAQASFDHLMVRGTNDQMFSPLFLALPKGNASGLHILLLLFGGCATSWWLLRLVISLKTFPQFYNFGSFSYIMVGIIFCSQSFPYLIPCVGLGWMLPL